MQQSDKLLQYPASKTKNSCKKYLSYVKFTDIIVILIAS